MLRSALLFLSLLVATSHALASAPATFDQAKRLLRTQVYHDQNMGGQQGTVYCGCDWQWAGASGGRIDHGSCGYEVRRNSVRGDRIEWEHIEPASNFGRARQCWQNGGRTNCKQTDPVFNAMEADMHNLTPSVGEVNMDRTNFRYGMLPQGVKQHGQCDVKVDTRDRVFEPRDEVKGFVARVSFYMHDRYDLQMSRQQQQLMMAWDRQHPPTAWEIERDQRIARIMGHSNPFVTGNRQWTLGHKNSREGVVSALPANHPVMQAQQPQSVDTGQVIHGNRNSRIYHLPSGCPSYNAMAPHNIVQFKTEAEAKEAGFKKAGNCR